MLGILNNFEVVITWLSFLVLLLQFVIDAKVYRRFGLYEERFKLVFNNLRIFILLHNLLL